MKNNDLMQNGNSTIRILDMEENKFLVIDCLKKSMPKWVDEAFVLKYSVCKDSDFEEYSDTEIDGSVRTKLDDIKAQIDGVIA